jgi:hypothetical protein
MITQNSKTELNSARNWHWKTAQIMTDNEGDKKNPPKRRIFQIYKIVFYSSRLLYDISSPNLASQNIADLSNIGKIAEHQKKPL